MLSLMARISMSPNGSTINPDMLFLETELRDVKFELSGVRRKLSKMETQLSDLHRLASLIKDRVELVDGAVRSSKKCH